MAEKILVLVDHGAGALRNASLETVAFAQKIASERGGRVTAVVFADDPASLSGPLEELDLDSIITVSDPKLSEYDPDVYCATLSMLVESDQPDLLLMAHTYQNIDMAPKLAARLKRSLATDCVGFKHGDDGLVLVRQMFRNKLNADLQLESAPPWIVTLQSGACSRDELQAGSASIEARSFDLSSVNARRQSLEAFESTGRKVDLTQAEIIVGVGRGIKKEENLSIIRELAEALGAEIGASRPVVDSEWLGRSRQIGSSGQTVSPKLYIAAGISGAIQHIVGMKTSQCIVAINTDPNAPIFNIATYGIVGDLFEVVPELTKRLREG